MTRTLWRMTFALFLCTVSGSFIHVSGVQAQPTKQQVQPAAPNAGMGPGMMQGQGIMGQGGMPGAKMMPGGTMPPMPMSAYGCPYMMPSEMGMMGGWMMNQDAKTRGQFMQLRGKMMQEMGEWMEKRGKEIETGK